jgi:DNA-directed RNA polymerase alpha subunit
MNATEILSKLKEKFAEIMAAPIATPEAAPAAEAMPVMETRKLKDGTEVSAASFDPGAVLYVGSVYAPAGVHELEDGTVLTVGENGVISEVKEVETIEDTTIEDMGKKLDKVTMDVSQFKSQFAEQNKVNQLESTVAKQSEIIKDLFEAVKFLAETPTGKPDAATKVETSFKQENKKDWAALAAQVIS